jgi:plastocyanin
MIIGFLVTAIVVTFVLAFTIVDSGKGEEAENGVVEPTATPAVGSTEVQLGDNFFRPKDITVQAGDTLTINLTSIGAVTHNMHISVDGAYAATFCEVGGPDPCSDPAAVNSGQTATLVWEVPDAPGTEIPFRCDFHPVEMTGTLTIVAAGEAGASPAGGASPTATP